jgi:hypothetical protein
MSAETPMTREIIRAIDRIKPILAGRPAAMQGAILADLLAIWLAGHHAEDEETTRRLRTQLLADHLAAVVALVAANAKIMGTTP